MSEQERVFSERQRRWIANKAGWEHMSQLAVLREWAPPLDDELTPCGCAACYGCPICKAAA